MAPVSSIPLHETARSRYLNYALSVITSRALPDIRDGLKPVQRRILYTMFASLRLFPDARYRKSATIVGDAMGKYHPHGDSAIYDAMARMAQDFSLRDPLVDGHGNFGSVDGDRPAAMRYTEAKLRPLAMEMLQELRQATVPFRPNFDGTLSEPVVLPSKVPNLLVNGATGIAVGMATNIPPHNLGEVISAAMYMVDGKLKAGGGEWPSVRIRTLVKRFIKGPDFPTGGRILNTEDELVAIYTKGEGPISLRGEYRMEGKSRVTINSIPYAINKGDLVEKIAENIASEKVPQITDVRDESTSDVRIVLELKRGASADAALGYLFRRTQLGTRFHVNLTALVPTENEQISAPRKFDLWTALRLFLDFRLDVVTRRLRHELEQLEKRIHILEGFEVVFDALDEAIKIIRSSRNRADAGQRLRHRFTLTEIQSDAILDTRLYKLSQMEIVAIREELKAKRKRVAEIVALLADEHARWRIVRAELKGIKDKYATPRRTTIGGPDEDTYSYSEADFIVDESTIIVVTRDGWVKRQRSYTNIGSIRIREGDQIGWIVTSRTRKTVTFWTNFGRAYTARVNTIPMSSGYGIPMQKLFDFTDRERVVGVASNYIKALPTVTFGKEQQPVEESGAGPIGYVLAFSRAGFCIRLGLDAFAEPSTKSGRYYMRVPDGDEVLGAWPVGGKEYACLASHNGRGLAFAVSDVPLRKSAGRGVQSIKLDDGDFVFGVTVSKKKSEGLVVKTKRGRMVTIRATKSYHGRRAAKGRAIINSGSLAQVVETPLE